MNVEIITPTSSLYNGAAQSVTVPSLKGPFTMLEHHAPIVAILEAGPVLLTDPQGEVHTFHILGGVCEQHDNHVIVCAEGLLPYDSPQHPEP